MDLAATANPVRAEFNGITFTYHRSAAEQVNPRVVPPGQHLAYQLPAYVEFAFGDQQPGQFYDEVATIRVFRVRDLEQVDPCGGYVRHPSFKSTSTVIVRAGGSSIGLHAASSLTPF